MMLLILLTALSTLLSNLETKTLQSDLSLTMQEHGQAALTTMGTVTMHGECFVGTARGYEMAYDGATLYVYDPDANELVLTHPIKEELMMSNPLLYAKYLSEVSTIRESVNKDGTITTVTMVPKGTPDEQVKVTLKIKNGMPLSVEVKEPRQTTSVRLKNPKYITTAPAFKVEKKGAYINDLR